MCRKYLKNEFARDYSSLFIDIFSNITKGIFMMYTKIVHGKSGFGANSISGNFSGMSLLYSLGYFSSEVTSEHIVWYTGEVPLSLHGHLCAL